MTARTTETTLAFAHPFRLSAVEGVMPAGTYRLVIDEEEIHGLSFLAFQRTATLLHLPAIAAMGHSREVIDVDPAELDAAILADRSA